MERSKIGLLLAKIEGTYGTDSSPTATANAIGVAGMVTYDCQVDMNDRDILDGDYANVAGLTSNPRAKMSFEVELRGNYIGGATDSDISSGKSTNAVEIDCLLQACDLTPTYTVETGGGHNGKVVYNPTVNLTAPGQSVTLYFYTGLKLHKLVGGKGNVKGTVKSGGLGKLSFTFDGLDGGTTDVAMPTTGVFLGTIPPLFAGATATLNSISPTFEEFTFDLGNVVSMRSDANSANAIKGFMITGRNSTCTLNPENVAEGTNPFFGDLKNGVRKPLAVAWGSQVGNEIAVNLNVMTKSVAYADKTGGRIVQATFDVRRLLTETIGSEFALQFN